MSATASASKRSLLYSNCPASRPPSSDSTSVRSNLEVSEGISTRLSLRFASFSGTAGAFCSANIT
jgi:hypothetical protein